MFTILMSAAERLMAACHDTAAVVRDRGIVGAGQVGDRVEGAAAAIMMGLRHDQDAAVAAATVADRQGTVFR